MYTEPFVCYRRKYRSLLIREENPVKISTTIKDFITYEKMAMGPEGKLPVFFDRRKDDWL
jgi:hypothetical protein